MVMILSVVTAGIAAGGLAWLWLYRRGLALQALRPTARGPALAPLPAGQAMQVAAADLRHRYLAHVLGLPVGGPADDMAPPARQALVEEVTARLARADLAARHAPRRPALLPRLIQSVNDSAASARSIARIIGSDAALAASLLRIANSPLYRLQRRDVHSIERAVTLIGNDGIRQVISAALVQPVMVSASGADATLARQLWDYTLHLSLAAAEHARAVEHEDGFSAQLGGLLLGLGAAVVLQAADDVVQQQPGQQRDPAALLELLQQCSAPMAARIARQWQLAEPVVQALEQADTVTAGGLARSLRVAQMAASAAMLRADGQLEEADALAALSALIPAHAASWLWRRMDTPGSAQD